MFSCHLEVHACSAFPLTLPSLSNSHHSSNELRLQGHFSPHIIYLMTAWEKSYSRREGHRMSCMSFSVFNSSQPVTMETVSWGELKTKNAVQIQVAAGVRLSHQQIGGARSQEVWGRRKEPERTHPGIVGKFTRNHLSVSTEYTVVCTKCLLRIDKRYARKLSKVILRAVL